MKISKLLMAGFVLIVLVASGCASGKNENSEKKFSSLSSNVPTQKRNLCDILPLDVVSNITKTKFTKTKLQFADERPTIIDCQYLSDEAGTSMMIIINFDTEVQSAKQQFEQVKQYALDEKQPMEEVTGVGEEAFFGVTGMMTQINSLNKNAWLTMSMITNSTPEQQKEIAKQLANEVWNRL